MPSLRSRILERVIRYQSSTVYRNAGLGARRAILEDGARFLPMPSRVEVERVAVGLMPAEWLRPRGAPQERGVLFLHGGAFTMGSCTTHRALASRIAIAGGTAVLLPEFRLAPEHPFPASLEDCLTAYRWLLDRGTPPRRIALAGDSSGAALAVSLAMRTRDGGLPLPAAIACLSPWADLGLTGETLTTRAQLDPVCSVSESRFHAGHYIGALDPRDPRLSPIYADLRGLPPILIQAGDHEILLSDALRLAERARTCGVETELEVWDGMWHVWHFFAGYVPEAREAIDRVGAFLREHLDPVH